MTTNKDNDKLRRKIKKLLALGNSKDYGLAQSAGYKQGQEVTLNHGVNGKETDKLGIRQ